MKPQVVILAGGKGTRLWPLSRADRPKQFLPLPFEKTLLEQAWNRARSVAGANDIWVVTLKSQVRETLRVLPKLSRKRVIGEPEGKNTAPAVSAATLQIVAAKKGKPTPILVLPADHFVPDRKRFAQAMRRGIARAAKGESIITFGLPVKSPETGYGYIETKQVRGSIRKVQRFVEKPSLARARRFMASGRHFWNSGIFAWRSDLFLEEMKRWAPKVYNPLTSVKKSELAKAYRRLPSISIDYALMEKSRRVEVIPSAFSWSDLGTWSAVYEAMAKRKGENVILGKGRAVDGRGNLIRSDQGEIVTFGLDDLVVVQAGETTLITTQEKSTNLKELLKNF